MNYYSLISETRKRVDEIKPGYGTNAASQNIFERLHLDVVQGHNPGGIPRENFEVNMGNNESGRKYDKDGNVITSNNVNEFLIQMEYVVPDSYGEFIFEYFCDNN